MGREGPETKLVNKMRKQGLADYGDRLVQVKQHGTEFSRSGASDLLCCLDGVFIACEVKAPESYGGSIERALRKGPTLKQRLFVGHVLKAGGCAGFAVTVDQYNEILDHAAERAVSGTETPCYGHYILEDE